MTTRELSASRTRRHLAAAQAVWPGALPALKAEANALPSAPATRGVKAEQEGWL